MRTRALLILIILAAATLIAGCGGGDDTGGGAEAPGVDAALVADVEAAAEGATGIEIESVALPEGAADAGVGAVLSGGTERQDGQRLVVAVGAGDTPNDIDDVLRARLAALAAIDMESASSELGWGSRVAKSALAPVYIIYLAEAGTRDELATVDRSEALKQALTPLGYRD